MAGRPMVMPRERADVGWHSPPHTNGPDRPRGGCTGDGIVRAVSVILLPRRSVTNHRVKRRVVHNPGTNSRHHRGCLRAKHPLAGGATQTSRCWRRAGRRAHLHDPAGDPGAWQPLGHLRTARCAVRDDPAARAEYFTLTRSPAPPDPSHRPPNPVVRPSGEPLLKHGALDTPGAGG